MGQGALHLKKYRNYFRTVSKKRDFWCNDTLMIFFLINGGFFKTKCWKQQTPYDHCQYIHIWPGTGHHRSLAAPPYWSNSNITFHSSCSFESGVAKSRLRLSLKDTRFQRIFHVDFEWMKLIYFVTLTPFQ